ncbi:MAG: cation transporter [Lachnospiraceae bacterium]|nr:cation transporter [Lachnospiraceae bacterium]
MITMLANLFKYEDLPTEKKRSAYGKLCGLVGILLNLILFVGKFIAGMLSNSIAITADAFNNLSDAGSSVVTLVGFKLAEQKPDADHPFGHGRIEYLSALAIAGVILLMAFELIKDSISKIVNPVEIEFSGIILAILIASILVKCYMALYNFRVGKKIDSAALKATGTDSLSDCVSTTVILIATLVGHYTEFQIDGFCGVAVGLLILWAGINAAKDVLDPLLGQAPDPEFVAQIEEMVMEFDKDSIVGVHDLIVHDYGPGRRVISLHAEVPAEGDILQLHDVIDNLEVKLRTELGCLTTIHMDPVATKDERVLALKEQCKTIVKNIGDSLSLHDFRVVLGESHTNLIFDVVIPYEFALSDAETTQLIQEKVWEQIGNNYFTVIQVDKKGGL